MIKSKSKSKTAEILKTRVFLALFCALITLQKAHSNQSIAWPNGTKVALSLSYDDALNSQLDNAVPMLDKHGFKASFYLTLSSPTIQDRLADWRTLAQNGHELGNHTIFHPCSGSLPERDWVAPYHDMDKRTLKQMEQEIITANAFLNAIDGQTERTFTPPCGDLIASGENYLPAIRHLFVAIKLNEQPPVLSVTWDVTNMTGAELIASLEEKDLDGKLVNLIFHGIGGDYLAISNSAHEELLQYLADNRDVYYVDTYLSIMKHAHAQTAKRNSNQLKQQTPSR